jgi:AraC-like DNA-binding protein
MLEKIIYLLTAFTGFITILLIGFRFNSNKHTNIYLLLFFFFSSFRFLAHGFLEVVPFLKFIKEIDAIFLITAWPLLYLYFGKLNNSHDHLKGKQLLHLVTPLLIIVLFCIKNLCSKEVDLVGSKLGFVTTVLYNIIYAFATYMLLKHTIWQRNSAILVINQQNIIITKWTKLLFGLFIIMLIRFFINLSMNQSEFWYTNQNNFLWVGAIIWIILYIKILYSPDFLYGYDVFQSKIKEYQKHAIVFDHIWITTSKQVINIQDTALKEKIGDAIQNYILEVEHIALNTNLFLTENFKLTDLAHKLNLPKSHLVYLFKYHASISFSDFKKVIRIQKSIALIDQGYLKNNTLESLATYTGFSSYSPFFNSFKSIAGMSPKRYADNL